MRRLFPHIASYGVAAMLASCAATKTEPAVAPTPVPGNMTPTVPDVSADSPVTAGTESVGAAVPQPVDGLRMPDLLGLPQEEDLRTSKPTAPGSTGGPVISRPPTDPPSRQKPAQE